MVHIGKPLITSHYNDKEFARASILNVETSIETVNTKILKPARKNGVRRKKSQAKARKSTKF
ncbi:MAG: hypothetical protein MSD68_07420 [Blautia sp.]|uniref:hypothetical protein n=1 Tax=Blautia sp. TaxID=1955243 RepID=UPI0025C66E66|nr:hypothetical protein [Blautia sp.]MCI7449516.1 hypothetical protein [Blautia sp.]